MNLLAAVKANSQEEVQKVVDRAVEKYKCDKPAEPSVETAYGAVKVSILQDDKSKWEIVTAEVMDISRIADTIPAELDRETEIAKMIATSGILRNIFAEPANNGDFL